MELYELIAPCHFGLEAVMKREILDLGYEIERVEDGKVTFLADAEGIAYANLFLRTTERILLKVGQDIKIEFTGLRPGEKLYEELLMDEEGMTDTPNKLIHIGHPIDVDEVKLAHALRVLESAAQNETDDMRLIVESIVPTYHPKLNKSTQ